MKWSLDEEFDYTPNVGDISLEPITVSWNLTDDEMEEIIITLVEWNDDTGHRHYTGDELWEIDNDLAENIMEHIDVEFISNDDFWLDKSNTEL